MSSVQEQNNPFAPPRAQVDDVTAEGGIVLASRWARLGGAIIDGLIAAALMWVVSLVTPWNPFDPAKANMFRFALVDGVIGFGVLMAIQAYPLVTAGQTWGKKALGMRIVRPDGSRVDPVRLIGLRYGVPVIFSVMPALTQAWGFVNALFIFRASRRCLHDSIADTIVIKV